MSSTFVKAPLVLTLDAGGTNFAFSALRGGRRVAGPIVLPAEAEDLDRSLGNLIDGFKRVADEADDSVDAISFAFPGPADYAAGVIYNQGNLPAYAGGVPLGQLLRERFNVPVLINNDGDLFAFGEALFGQLPKINFRLKDAGSNRRYRNLIGLTLGTGFGGGIVVNGQLLRGDNGLAGEVWLLRHGFRPDVSAEEGISIRAIQSAYATVTDSAVNDLTPRDIAQIATGKAPGDMNAARYAYAQLGRSLGEAIANLVTVIDGVVVLGGGLSEAHPLFLPGLMDVVNGAFSDRPEAPRRLVQRVYNLESAAGERSFFTADRLDDDAAPPEPRIAVAVSSLGASEAVARGAYAIALKSLREE